MDNSRTSHSVKNILASIGYQLLNLILGFVSRTVFIQALGVGYLGISGLFQDVLAMLNMAELGLGTVMTFSMYKPLAEQDQDTLAALTQFYKRVYRVIAAVIAGIGIALIPLLPYLVTLQQRPDHLVLYYLLFLASHVASYLVCYKTTVLYADQKNYILLKASALWSTAQTAVLTAILYFTRNYLLFLALQVVFVYLSNFHKSHIAQRHYPFISKKVPLPREVAWRIFRDTAASFLYKISNVLLSATDNFLISILISTETVGYYSNYQLIVTRLSNMVGTLFYSLIASLGNLVATESGSHRYRVFQAMQTLSLLLSGFCTTCLLLLSEDFIRIWLGPEFTLGPVSLAVIAIHFYLSVSTMPIAAFREAAGLFRRTKYIMLCTAALNILFSVLLGRRIGLSGILLATSLSKLLTLFWYEPMLLFREFFGCPSRDYYIGMLKGVVAMLLSLLLGRVATFWILPTNWLSLLLKGGIAATASAAALLWVYCRDSSFHLLVSRLAVILKPFRQVILCRKSV